MLEEEKGASVEAQKKTTFSVYLCESLSPTPHIGDWALMSQGGERRWLGNWESSENFPPKIATFDQI